MKLFSEKDRNNGKVSPRIETYSNESTLENNLAKKVVELLISVRLIRGKSIVKSTRRVVEAALEGGVTQWIAFNDFGEVVGFAQSRVKTEPDKIIHHLNYLAVHHDWSGGGVARSLHDYFKQSTQVGEGGGDWPVYQELNIFNTRNTFREYFRLVMMYWRWGYRPISLINFGGEWRNGPIA